MGGIAVPPCDGGAWVCPPDEGGGRGGPSPGGPPSPGTETLSRLPANARGAPTPMPGTPPTGPELSPGTCMSVRGRLAVRDSAVPVAGADIPGITKLVLPPKLPPVPGTAEGGPALALLL